MLGAFCAQDLALFVVFFDLMLVPFYFLIGGWGTRRPRARHHQVRDLHAGRLAPDAGRRGGARRARHARGRRDLVLARRRSRSGRSRRARSSGSSCCSRSPSSSRRRCSRSTAGCPTTYRSTPIPVLALLSAVLSKVGVYGFLRIVLPILPDAAQHFQEIVMALAVFSILYGSALAFTQDEARLVVAYSSIAQLGFITLGIFSLDDKGAQGALMQMVNHGLVVAPLFFIVGAAGRARRRQRLAGADGRDRPPRAGAGRAVPDHHVRDAGDARLAQLRRRDPDPVRRLRGQVRLRPGGERRRRAGGRLHDPRSSSARCTTASGRGSSRASSCRLDFA